jgi:hypothetical protein
MIREGEWDMFPRRACPELVERVGASIVGDGDSPTKSRWVENDLG